MKKNAQHHYQGNSKSKPQCNIRPVRMAIIETKQQHTKDKKCW